MIGPTCPRCHRIGHPTAMVGRFSWRVPGYRADYPDAPIRTTRAEAQADACARQAAIRDTTEGDRP